MYYQLIYTSAAAPSLTDDGLKDIALTANRTNPALGITGLLLHKDGTILQVLEGDKFAVKALYNKIARDPRHTQTMILIEREVERREFGNWAMGYRPVGDDTQSEYLFTLTMHNLRSVMPEEPSQELDAMTRTYAKVSGL